MATLKALLRSQQAAHAAAVKTVTGGPPDQPVILYDYDPSRSGEVPVRRREGYRGYLMTDGYEGYNAVAKTEGIEHLACWAHRRRRFGEAARGRPARYTERGDLHNRVQVPIDNNRCENAIRPIAIGRRNWLFAGSGRAGKRAAAIQTLLGTAKLNCIKPGAWPEGRAGKTPHLAEQPHRRITAPALDC